VDTPLHGVTGFQRDVGNVTKSQSEHGVLPVEAEEVFLNGPTVADSVRSGVAERRWVAFGLTDAGKPLAIAFTVRGSLIRVITDTCIIERGRPRRGARGVHAASTHKASAGRRFWGRWGIGTVKRAEARTPRAIPQGSVVRGP